MSVGLVVELQQKAPVRKRFVVMWALKVRSSVQWKVQGYPCLLFHVFFVREHAIYLAHQKPPVGLPLEKPCASPFRTPSPLKVEH